MKTEKTTVHRETTKVTLAREDVIKLLRGTGCNVPEDAQVKFHVPGGGDYSNMALDVDESSPIEVEWTIEDGDENESGD